MKKIIALTAFALLASAPAVQSAPVATQHLRATDFSSIKEVDPAPQGKLKGVKSRKSKGGPSSGAEEVGFKEVDPAPQGKLKGMKSKKKGGPSSGVEEVGFNPQPDPPGVDKNKGAEMSGPSPHMNSPRLDTPRFSVPSLGGAGGARVR